MHQEAENFKLENQKKNASPLPWHPGAVKYFADKGINEERAKALVTYMKSLRE